jgi:hypothetical protein
MDSKLSSIVITSLLAFALIAGVPAVFENVLAQQDDNGQTGGDAGMDQSQTGGDAGMDQTQGNDTGMAQSQPGADTGSMTQDQGSADVSGDVEEEEEEEEEDDDEDKEKDKADE